MVLRDVNKLIHARVNSAQLEGVESLLEVELEVSELMKCDDVDLYIHQLWIARVHQLFGAYETPLRIANNLLHILKLKIKSFSLSDLELLLSRLAVLYYESSSFSGILKVQSVFSDLYADRLKSPPSHQVYFDFLLLQAQINLDIMDLDSDVLSELSFIRDRCQENAPLRDCIEYQICCLLFAFDKEPLSTLIVRIQKNKEHTTLSIVPFYNHLLTKIYLRQKELDLAYKHLTLDKDKNTYLHIEELFLLKFKLNQELPPGEDFLLHCYPGLNEYSFLLGHKYFSDELYVSSFFKNQVDFDFDSHRLSDADHWIYRSGRLHSTHASSRIGEGEFIDLQTGKVVQDGTIFFLGKMKSIALLTVIGMGLRGASAIQIAEKVYVDESLSFESAQYRVMDLMVQIQKKNLPIRKRGHHYFFDFKVFKGEILFPKDHLFKGEFYDLYLHQREISKETVRRHFDVSPRTASNYLQEWKILGLIEKRSKNYGRYFFNEHHVQNYVRNLKTRLRSLDPS